MDGRRFDPTSTKEWSKAEMRTNAGKGESKTMQMRDDGRHAVKVKPRRRKDWLRQDFRVVVFPFVERFPHTISRTLARPLLCGEKPAAKGGDFGANEMGLDELHCRLLIGPGDFGPNSPIPTCELRASTSGGPCHEKWAPSQTQLHFMYVGRRLTMSFMCFLSRQLRQSASRSRTCNGHPR